MLKKAVVFMTVLSVVALFVFGCGNGDDTDAELAVKDFVTQHTGIQFASYGHKLETEEIGLQVEETRYRVMGKYEAEDGRMIPVQSIVKQLGNGWELEFLRVDGNVLYEK